MAVSVARGEPVCRKEDCSPFDIGTVFSTIGRFTDAEKFRFIKNLWRPDALYDFPTSVETHGSLRKFRLEWLARYGWLAYSKYVDGAFCVPCVCFGMKGGRLDKLFLSPLTFWSTAITRFNNHSNGKCETHNKSVLDMAKFMAIMRREVVPIDQQLDRLVQQQINENRKKIQSIIKIIIFCGQHNIPLRGRRDDNPDDSSLQGNFQALVDFRMESGDTALAELIQNAPRNATYRSKTIQNEIIATVGSYISSQLSTKIKTSRLFSILADEAADISNKEHLSLVVRFVDVTTKSIQEEFVGFHQCEQGTTGEAIKQLILKAVSDLGLSMDDCRGQSYDGAGNMAGKYSGASTLIQRAFPKAVYVHCMNHRLNLCVANTCSIPIVRNMMGTVRKISEFFNNSPKRQHHLVEKIKSLLPHSNHRVLIDVCRTRWIARIDGMDRIVELFLPIMATLEDIRLNKNGDAPGSGDWNSSSRGDAQSLTNAVTFQFVVALVIVRYILGLSRPATVKLQREGMDILKAQQEISTLKETLQAMQVNINADHHKYYEEAVKLAEKIDIQPKQPRYVQQQVYRDNLPASSPEEYYRINLTRVFLDHVVQQLNTRFPPEVYICFKGTSIVPAILLRSLDTWKLYVSQFCEHYVEDIPNIAGLSAELELWQRMWIERKEKKDTIPEKISDTLKDVDPLAFPNVFGILQLLATIPVTSCSCERSISSLRHLKSYLRSTMGQERLNGLALMYCHRDMPLDLDEIVNLFATLHPRRMRMTHILCSDPDVTQ